LPTIVATEDFAPTLIHVTNQTKYVNMADVNFKPDHGRHDGNLAAARPPIRTPLSAEDRPEIAYIELLFFAYRDFISDPDAVLATFAFGRAHHRVIHFVNRHPGIRVADLLDGVLKQLIDGGFIEQLPGPVDRRQRLLYPTESGRALSLRLLDPQEKRIRAALAALSPAERVGAEKFLRQVIDVGERPMVAKLIGK